MLTKRSFSVVVLIYIVAAAVIAALIAGSLHANSAGPSSSQPTSQQPSAGKVRTVPALVPKYLVLMVLDGARPDYLGMTPLPNLDALIANGAEFTNSVDGILEAETPAGHATIATGSRPNRDGILGFDWANDNDRVSLFNPDQMTTLEGILQSEHTSTIAGLYKKANPGAVAVALSGHKYYAAAPLGGPDADAIIYYQGDPKGRYVPVSVPGHAPPADVMSGPGLVLPTTHLATGQEDHLATTMAMSVITKMHPRLLLINYPEFDWPVGHVDGGSLDPSAVIALMKGFDADLGRIEDEYRTLGILNQTLFVITADHGMMPISRFVPSSLITNAISQAGTTSPDIASNSGDYVWLADPSKAAQVAQNIANTHDAGIQSVYYLTTVNGATQYALAPGMNLDSGTETANQYLLGALLNGHEPNVVVFGNEGVSFSDPSTHWKADHGGNSFQSQHIPLIFSGPGIKAGTVIDSPAQLDDIAPTVLQVMGVTPTGMDGHVLMDALTTPNAADMSARDAEIQQLQPVVNALKQDEQQTSGS